jgi:hypothetical protein
VTTSKRSVRTALEASAPSKIAATSSVVKLPAASGQQRHSSHPRGISGSAEDRCGGRGPPVHLVVQETSRQDRAPTAQKAKRDDQDTAEAGTD